MSDARVERMMPKMEQVHYVFMMLESEEVQIHQPELHPVGGKIKEYMLNWLNSLSWQGEFKVKDTKCMNDFGYIFNLLPGW